MVVSANSQRGVPYIQSEFSDSMWLYCHLHFPISWVPVGTRIALR